jgi:CheY-like chemotaxis protein
MNSKAKAKRAARTSVKTILLVDDDPSVREMIGRVLAGECYHVLSAANGFEAIEVASANSIDLVLLDLNMPGKDGWDTFERITSENPNLAVVIITAKPDQLFTSLAAGVGALLEKPLDFNLLLKTVSELLNEPAEQRLARMTGKE